MNIRQTIISSEKRHIEDKIARVRIARGWRVRFQKLPKGMTIQKFCERYRFNVFTVSHYINQTLADVKAQIPARRPRIASWKMIERMDKCLKKEGV